MQNVSIVTKKCHSCDPICKSEASSTHPIHSPLSSSNPIVIHVYLNVLWI
jgi:hypothetical protein